MAAVWTGTAAATIAFASPAHTDAAPVNLPVTDQVAAELVEAGAVLTGRPAFEFTGLVDGRTYYAEYPDSGTRYAAAKLAGKPEFLEASIMLQDQNSYMMFTKSGKPGATWVPTAAGFGPIPAGQAACPIPQSVRDLWQWPAGKCYPPPA
jgi:hypothetical protein